MAENELPGRWVNPEKLILLQDLGLLLFRLGIGALLLTQHGWGKYMGFAEKSEKFADPLGVGHVTSMAMAIFAEVVCSFLVMIGLATRLAAIVVAMTFMVIVNVVHGADPLKEKELAVVYLLTFAVIVLTGPGRSSIDAMLKHAWIKRHNAQPASEKAAEK